MKEAEFRKLYPNAPKELFEKGKAVRMVFIGLPLFIITSAVLYKRLFLGEEKRVQTGEIMNDGSIRMFSAKEIEYHDKNSIFTKLFGQDKVDYEAAANKGK